MNLYDIYFYFGVKFPGEKEFAWRKSSKPLKFFLKGYLDDEGSQHLDFLLNDLGCKRWLNYTVTDGTRGKIYFSVTYAGEVRGFFILSGFESGSVIKAHTRVCKSFDRVEDQVFGVINWVKENIYK